MSTVKQIYDIVNAVTKMALGDTGINVVDTSTLVALGDSVLSSESDTDRWTSSLVDRIGTTVFSVQRYVADTEGMTRHPFEFGCIVQKIYVDLPEARENNSWKIGEQNYKPEFAPVIKPSIKQKLFKGVTTWEIAVTVPDYILKTAFTNAAAMATLIDAIFTTMDNMMSLALENNANLTRASFIARKLKNESKCGAINLLKEYNTLTNAGLTRDAAMRNSEFLAWASMQIDLWSKRIRKMSKVFNDEGYTRHTSRENLVINVLQDFASATDTFLKSNTFHNELVALPNYRPVQYWQGSGESFDFADTSKINVRLDGDAEQTQDGIIAVMYDFEAMGITMDKRRSASERNTHDEYTNYYNKADIGYFNDMSENGIVFYLSES